MQTTSLERTPEGVAEFVGQAQGVRGRKYLFFASRDGSAAVFREQGHGFSQSKPNMPKALSAAIRRAVRKAVQS
jgi:hypothetical protein